MSLFLATPKNPEKSCKAVAKNNLLTFAKNRKCELKITTTPFDDGSWKKEWQAYESNSFSVTVDPSEKGKQSKSNWSV